MPETASVSHVESVTDTALAELAAAGTSEQVEAWRIAWLGRRGQLTQMLRGIRDLAPDERRSVGAAANQAKNVLEQSLAQHQDAIASATSDAEDLADAIDVTLPGWPAPIGGLHPTTQMLREICDAFGSMGFDVVEGPEVEWDLYNFEMLNIP
ncbi:Phenylalanine--tRNA ligase alpha subunit [Geodia barretti]|uniref:Phenylalanine--tRNA ligase alpha subunit n=1 Tax=Geodia barretti TaxID=519541 RepID=A0AA35TJ80_GEOBA|nr:Phenylalanine--tRNA ligase alpha subunit [Geodia barretti]